MLCRFRTTHRTWLLSLALASLCFALPAGAAVSAPPRPEPPPTFRPVERPEVPSGKSGPAADPAHERSAIDRFLEEQRRGRQLTPQPEASRDVLLRRVTMDLLGLNPTPEERAQFLADRSPEAYERLVDRLLADPRYGERWGRHWMDVWRYSDWAGWTDGGQVRDSKPHIWRWRDWIVESLNADKPYDQMVLEMLAGDEIAPEDPNTVRATGFLVRNYKMLSREQWLEDTVKHTSQAFLGITMGCAKCHDHMFDPISQQDYYRLRAIFEPHQVRLDRVPGELNTTSNGVARTYDAAPPPTYLFHRGDERHPITNQVIAPGVPSSLGGRYEAREVALPPLASQPDRRPFVISDLLAEAATNTRLAWEKFQRAQAGKTNESSQVIELELKAAEARLREQALAAVIAAEPGSELLTKSNAAPDAAYASAVSLAKVAVQAQRALAVAEAETQRHLAHGKFLAAEAKAKEAAPKPTSTAPAAASAQPATESKPGKLEQAVEEARKKLEEAEKGLQAARADAAKEPGIAFKPRPGETFPATSTGRRLAFARWVIAPENPLTARVAVNHMWLRHFGRGLVPNPADFGRNGRPPTHPALLDWLADDFVRTGWSMKRLHRQILLSAAYRMSSGSEPQSALRDPDNLYLWRMNPRRLEAEAVRDNLLHAGGQLDPTFGGPDIDHKQALTSRRRSIYLRHAAEKQAEFLQIFDGASVTECYERHPSVMPQQALALANSSLALQQAKSLSRQLEQVSQGDETRFVNLAFERILVRPPTPAELKECLAFLRPTPTGGGSAKSTVNRPTDNLILVLFNHNDFVTVR